MQDKKQWPQVVKDLFPMLAVFYRPKPGKPRKKKVQVHSVVDGQNVTTTTLVNYKKHKKSGVGDQNNYSIITVALMVPDDFGTMVRNLKHKGYPEFIGAVDLSEEEELRANYSTRYILWKYKSFDEMYNVRQVYDEYTEALRDRLNVLYDCKATGQTRLF